MSQKAKQICHILATIYIVFMTIWASLMAQMVKNPPAVQETWVQSLGWENPLEKEMVICFSILFFIIFIKKKFF